MGDQQVDDERVQILSANSFLAPVGDFRQELLFFRFLSSQIQHSSFEKTGADFRHLRRRLLSGHEGALLY